MQPASSMAPGPASWKRWTVCLLLFGATTLNYLDRQTISILAPTIQAEMGLSNASLGWLFSAFYYSYTFAQFGAGYFLDRWNLRWVFAAAVVAWSTVAGLTSLSSTFAMLLFFRVLLGVAESPNWPAAIRIVSRVLPPADRSLGNGIFTSGTSIGALIAPALILGIASLAGWRAALIGVGSFGLVWVAVWFAFTRDRALAPVWTANERNARPAIGVYIGLLSSRRFWQVFAVTILVNPCLYFNLNWLPVYLVQQRGVKAGAELSGILTLAYLGLDLGYLACGFASRALAKRMPLGCARRVVFLSATALMGVAAAIPFAGSQQLLIAALMTLNFAAGCWIAMYLTMAQEVSSEDVSTAAGLLGGSGSLAGALAMWAVGWVTTATGSFSAPFAAVAAAGVLAAIAGWSVTSGDR